MYAGLLGIALLGFAGCASPGAPQPPSLHLPRPVSDLQAQRVGDSVQLRWTMPGDTTDNLTLTGEKMVAVCRRTGSGVCVQVKSFSEMPKAKIAIEDALPETAAKGPPELLTYEVQVMNTSGHSAGASNPAYAASGAAPASVNALHATVTEKGVVLRWEQSADSGAEILLRREKAKLATPAVAAKKSAKPVNPLGTKSEPAEKVLRVRSDAGGTIDTSAVFGERYAYIVQRVKRLDLSGQHIEIHSESSAPVSVEVRDLFPPHMPEGLAAAEPVHAADGSYALDLSWEANAETDLAGYFVYRRDMTSLSPVARVNALPVAAPALHDAGLQRGHAYMYSVSAVDKSGNESKHTAVLEEDVPDR